MPRYAAIDIGSNSVRMEAAEVVPGQPTRVLASDREVTRLGESVFRSGAVSEEALRATCAVLARMAANYRRLDVVGVRAVATSAIRDTRNQRDFLARASEAAGTAGGDHLRPGRGAADPPGGGEQLAAERAIDAWCSISAAAARKSLQPKTAVCWTRFRDRWAPFGCAKCFLPDDPPAPRQLHQMQEYIDEKLEGAVRAAGYRNRGTAPSPRRPRAAAVASAVARVPRSKRDEVDRLRVPTAQVRKLYRKLSELGLAGAAQGHRHRPAARGDHRPGGGVLLHFLDAFHAPAYYYSRAGVRDGIIADLAARNVGAERSRLSREQRREVEQMGRRYGVSREHARKVAEISALLFHALQPLHGLPPESGKLLEAAAYLHDVGHFVSGTSHHKHSYYVVSNSDMAGFTERERLLIATLCRYHRKSLPNPLHNTFQALGTDDRKMLMPLIPILRLADNLVLGDNHHILGVDCTLKNGAVVLEVRARGDIDLEQWGVDRAGEAFRQVYSRPVSVVEVRGITCGNTRDSRPRFCCAGSRFR